MSVLWLASVDRLVSVPKLWSFSFEDIKFLGKEIFDYKVIFKLHSKGNSTGYYWIRWNYCCYITPSDNENGKLSYLHFLEIIILFPVVSFITRRNKL